MHQRIAFIAALLVVATLPMIPAHGQKNTDSGIIETPAGDPKLEAAYKRAKETFGFFLERFAKPDGETSFSVKLKYDTVMIGRWEHIWASDLKREGDALTAAIANTPRDIPNLISGQRVTIDESRISDWGYVKKGKMHGYYTVRAILDRIPPDQAKFYRGILAPPR